MPEKIEAQLEDTTEEQLKANLFDKLKIHKFKILAGVLGVLIFTGAVFGAYKFGQKRAQISKKSKLCPCPAFMPPGPEFCPDGIIIPGKINECGCQMPPTCQKQEEAFVCVDKKSLNCAEEIELSFQCTEEYQRWARTNCPGWEETPSGERVSCKEPRPQFCTMECIVNPPYICGSDGKSYCSECQACANTKVEWYVIQNAPCGT